MRIQRVQTQNFRNLPSGVIDVDAPLVVFTGANGQGKTNWLEAIGVLGTLRSFRTARAAEMVAWGEQRATVEAAGSSEGMTRTWSWSFGEGARDLRRDDRAVEAIGWLSSMRATFFVPGDVALVRGEPALRRAVLDRAVLTLRPSYLAPARDLRRVLEHKAALLRTGSADIDALDALDDQLATLADIVTRARAETVARMADAFQASHAAFGGGEEVSVTYRPWSDGDVRGWLADHRGAERAARRVLGGPQRDDLAFLVHGQPARAYASQGQARSLVLAWKLAELEAAREGGETPLFLLDDLGSELDPVRTARLVDRVRSLGAQVFVTTTDVRYLPGSEARVFHVSSGVVAGVAEGGPPG